jgi:hypothetical protein
MVAVVVAALLGAPAGTLAQGRWDQRPIADRRTRRGDPPEVSLSNVAPTQSPSPPDGWGQLRPARWNAGSRELMDGTEIEGRLVEARTEAVVLADNRL